MSKKLIFVFTMVMLLAFFVVPIALAEGEPAGSCPTGFHMEKVMDHDAHHHQHVGSHTDVNGDGFVCVKHVTPDEKIHVHVDNILP